MSAEFMPEILEVRISRAELNTLKHLAVGLGDIIKLLGANIETRAAVLTLLAVIHRAEHS